MEGTTSPANNAGAVSGYLPAAAQRQEATPWTAESAYSAAPATGIAAPVDAPHYPPHVMTQTSPVMQPATCPQGTFAQPPTWSSAPPANHYSVQHDQAAAGGRMPVVSIISPDDTKKIRKMQLVNFACSMLQLACAIVIIIVVREELALYNFVTVGRGTFVNYYCFAATPAWQGTCEYAYALASTSIFFCFILSLMQCLTMDCCGVGRAMEAVFDSVMFVWWTAGTVVLAVRADEANAAGFPKRDARNAVVALAAISAFMFLALLLTNVVLIMRLGTAYKGASQQLQQHMTAVPLAAYPQQAPRAPATAMAPAPAGSNANQDAKNVDSVV